MSELDRRIRLRAFDWLREQRSIHGDVLPRSLLEKGFDFLGERIPLISPQGIFKPRLLDVPLSITTAPRGPYDDSFSDDGFLLYRYRGTDIYHRDNVGLREAFVRGLPLIYLYGVVPGRYLAAWPIYIIGDDPSVRTFKVAVDDMATLHLSVPEGAAAVTAIGRRAYITAIVRQRMHQRSFRERVLHAYREQCALCRIRHLELLDAAHIVPDIEPQGLPLLPNGIALCKLHHAAFDAFMLGITPDYRVEVRTDILDETDGPMLQHGMKDLHKVKIVLPRDKVAWPDRDLLDWRYQKFQSASGSL